MILANDFVRQWQDLEEDALAAFSAVGASGWYMLGEEVRRFEQELGAYCNVAQAIGVASGLDALQISLQALGCGPGDKVLTTPVSAFATTLAILKLGAVPVFADVDRNGLIDLEAARVALARDSAIRFFVPVHLFGHSLNLGKLAILQDESGVSVVEDCAQSIGARFDGIETGIVGRMAALSFYPTKNLGAMGDAGAILTGGPELAHKAKVLRDYGQSTKYRHEVIGYNSRLDELHAAFLRRAGFPRLTRWIDRRRQIAARYLTEIAHPAVESIAAPCGSESSWHLFPVLVPPQRKQNFVAYLQSCQIVPGEHYPTLIPDQPAMRNVHFEIAEEGINQSKSFCSSEVSLPIHPYLNDDEVTSVITAVNHWDR